MAQIRRMENLHKDQMALINKDTLRMLRAIVHFRDHMLACVQKENLVDQAQDLQDIGHIVKDKVHAVSLQTNYVNEILLESANFLQIDSKLLI